MLLASLPPRTQRKPRKVLLTKCFVEAWGTQALKKPDLFKTKLFFGLAAEGGNILMQISLQQLVLVLVSQASKDNLANKRLRDPYEAFERIDGAQTRGALLP